MPIKTKVKTKPIFKGLPASLKNPKNYKSIEQRLRLVLVSDHSHKTVKDYSLCARCIKKLQKKRLLLKEYGFKSYEQYMEWRKVMEIMNSEQFNEN